MDIKKVTAKDQDILPIVYPDGEETGVLVTVQSTQSPDVKRVLKKWDKIGSKSRKGLNFEQKETASIELISAAIVDWEGLEDGGKPIECSEENKRVILTDKNLRFIRDQIDEYIGDANNFFSKTEAT